MNVAFSSLIIILVVIILIVVSTKGMLPVGNILNKKKYLVRGAFVAYIIILMVSYLILIFIPKDSLIDSSIDEFLTSSNNNYTKIYDAIKNNSLNDVDGLYKVRQWEFSYNNDSLNITSSNDRHIDTRVHIIHKDKNDGMIDAFYYATNSIFMREDFSQKDKFPKISLYGDRMILNQSGDFIFNLVNYKYDFTYTQFFRGNVKGLINARAFSNLDRFIYICVPKGVVVSFSNVKLNFISAKD